MPAHSFGTRVTNARVARGLSCPALAAEAKIAPALLDEIETSGHIPDDLDTLHALAQALQVPVVYFVSRDYREFMQARYQALSESEQQRLHTLPVHARLEWAVRELELLWADGFSPATAFIHVPLIGPDDLPSVLSGELQLSGEQWQALFSAVGLPADLAHDTPVEIAPHELYRYIRVIQLARQMNVSPEALAHLLGKSLIN